MVERVFGVPHHVARVVMATVTLAACLGVVVGAAPTTEPSAAAAPAPGEDSGCLRPSSDIIWGFLVTLFACAVALWGYAKYSFIKRGDKVFIAFLAVFAPVVGLWYFIAQALQSAVLVWRYNKLCRNSSPPPSFREWYGHPKTLWSWVSPFSKSPGRILYGCDIVVYVKKESRLLQEKWLWRDSHCVEDVSEAMVIGEVAEGKTQYDHYECKELSLAGKTALLLAEVVPKYDELKFLRGNSGFAMIALAIQALGYIYAVVFRVVKDLPVAPLEVVGLILNIILLVEVIFFIFFNVCHRPLVIYMNSWREEKMLETMGHVKEQFIPQEFMFKKAFFVLVVVWMCICGIVVYFIVTLFKVSSILVVVPLIIFVFATIISIVTIPYIDFMHKRIWWFDILFTLVAYAWAFTVTIVYWKSQHFNARGELVNVSQLIPFIG